MTLNNSPRLFEEVEFNSIPFPYAIIKKFFPSDIAKSLLDWLEKDIQWRLHVEDFYEQYEINLLSLSMPDNIATNFKEMILHIRKKNWKRYLEPSYRRKLLYTVIN